VVYDYLKVEAKKRLGSKPGPLQAAVLGSLSTIVAQVGIRERDGSGLGAGRERQAQTQTQIQTQPQTQTDRQSARAGEAGQRVHRG